VLGGGAGTRRKSGGGIGGSDFTGRAVSYVSGSVGVSGSNTAGLRVNVGWGIMGKRGFGLGEGPIVSSSEREDSDGSSEVSVLDCTDL
jgi:hypothetical protein